jgi:hypothetical protein
MGLYATISEFSNIIGELLDNCSTILSTVEATSLKKNSFASGNCLTFTLISIFQHNGAILTSVIPNSLFSPGRNVLLR